MGEEGGWVRREGGEQEECFLFHLGLDDVIRDQRREGQDSAPGEEES